VSWYKKLDQLAEIPQGNYSGYIWLSDEDEPRTVSGVDARTYEQAGQPAHPFIREGFLYDEAAGISVTIYHTPTGYRIYQAILKQLPVECEKKDFNVLAHNRLPGDIKFTEIWQPEPDTLCDQLPVLRKKAVLFTGFTREVQS